MSAARSVFVNTFRKYISANRKDLVLNGQYTYLNCVKRAFATVPLEYNEKDPAPLFFSPNVQKLLRYVTRPRIEKVFRKRVNKNDKDLENPTYKFMTDSELQEELRKAEDKADHLLQIPPVLKVFVPKSDILAAEPALTAHDNSKFIFTDISYGLKNSERFVTIRDVDGTLYTADHDVRKRCLQIYFPSSGCNMLEPAMFNDENLLNDLLERKEYEFVLDRACVQYEPDEAKFQRITNKVYLNIDEKKDYELIRSTRHFGSMAFFLAWNNIIDNLFLEMLQNGYVREMVTLVNLQRTLHPELVPKDDSAVLAKEILKKQRHITDCTKYVETAEDKLLDKKCVECIRKYIQNNSSKKALHELAFQAYQDSIRERAELSNEINTAHGVQ